jgi:uncharacterized protein HemX
MKKSSLYAMIAVILVAGLGVAGWYLNTQGQQGVTDSTQQQTAATPTPVVTQGSESSSNSHEVSYQGEEGKTALELLQKNAEVEMTGEGEMAFVTTINGHKAKDNEFWAFYVNDQQAAVGAGSYMTKANDQIVWKLESFK